MNIKWLCIAVGIALLLAISPSWPYGYYIFLRWGVFIASLIVAWGLYKSKLTGWTLAFAALAFLFNPLFPIYLSRSTWAPIDLISSILFFVCSNSIKKKHI